MVQEAAVLRRRLDVHQIEQPKEQASVPGVDRPKQRQFVVAMQGRYRLALLCQRVDSALFRQELPDLAAECGIGFLALGRLKYFPKDADQGFLDATLLGVEGFQLLLGQGLCSADTAQHHFDQLIASAHPCLAQQGKYQRMTFARLRDVEKIIHLQGGGLRGELAELGMGDTLQKRIRIEHTGQPIKPIDPQINRFWCRGTRRLLEAIEAGRRTVGRLGQQGLQRRYMLGRQTYCYPIENPSMNFRAHPVYQPVERAERRQVDRSCKQRLDRSVDEVGRVAHALRGLDRGAADQALTRLGIWGYRKMRPDCSLIPVQRLRTRFLVGRDRWDGQAHLRSQIRGRVSVDFVRRCEIAEVLAGLQQDREQHAAGIAAGTRADEGEVRVAQLVSGAQLLSGQPRTRPRIGSAVNGRHEVSRKGLAEAAERSV